MFTAEIWTNKGPRHYTRPSFAFFPEALNEIGRAVFGDRWTGDEATDIGPGPKVPPAADVFVGKSDVPENFDLLRDHQASVFELLALRPVGTPTYQQWCDARTRWYEKDIEWLGSAKRLMDVVDIIHDLAAEGDAIISYRRSSDGEMFPLKKGVWNCERALVFDRFSRCAIPSADIFGPARTIPQLLAESEHDREDYFAAYTEGLFVRRDHLDKAVRRIEELLRSAAGNGSSESITSDMPSAAPDENGKAVEVTEITEHQPWRPKGAGEFVHTDEAFVDEMRRLIEAKEVGSIKAAAYRQWPTCGGASIEAAEKRLRRKYRAKYCAADRCGVRSSW